MLIGNKLDLSDQREVSYEEASKFAEENGLIYMETSAKNGDNVEEVFVTTAKKIHSNIENGTLDPNASIECGVQSLRTLIDDSANNADAKTGNSNCACWKKEKPQFFFVSKKIAENFQFRVENFVENFWVSFKLVVNYESETWKE